MSQVPSNNDIPGNSYKEQQARQEADENKKPEVEPFEGEVAGAKRKGKGFWAWCRKMFLSDRKPSEIAMDILENQIVPGFKDNVRNGLVSGIDGFIYQSTKPATQSSVNNTVSYNNIFRASTAPSKPQTPTPSSNDNDIDLSNGFANPCFKTRIEAERFLNTKMKTYDYPTLSVHTLYLMMKKRIDFTWDIYGWNREEIASWDPAKIIKHISNPEWPWVIDLPQAHLIS